MAVCLSFLFSECIPIAFTTVERSHNHDETTTSKFQAIMGSLTAQKVLVPASAREQAQFEWGADEVEDKDAEDNYRRQMKTVDPEWFNARISRAILTETLRRHGGFPGWLRV